MGRSTPLLSLLVLTLVGGGSAVALAAEQPVGALLVLVLCLLSGVVTHRMLAGLPTTAQREIEAARRGLEDRLGTTRERRVRMRVKAETASRFREEFVAAVRHELKTPLNAILGFSDVLLEGVDGPLDEQQREDVEAIQAGGLYLEDLVESVLSEWVPEDEPTTPLATIDLGPLLFEVARLVRGQITRDKPVAIEVRVHEDGLKVVGDPRRMRQIFINLATNAIRATERGSVTLEARQDGDDVRLTVRDTGAGIRPEELPHLFTEFVQVGTEGGQMGGSGLGLALTLAMVEWHDGRIEVETKLGEGSAFHVILPTELR